MSRRGRRKFVTVAATSVVLLLTLAACGNATTHNSSGGSGDPGVSATEIDVGSIANVTGPLSADFAPVVNGVEAYFSMVNAAGGVDGRRLKLAFQTDDQGSPATDLADAQKLVEQDHVFALVGVGTPFFGGSAYLAQQGVPTFGYAVSTEWQNHPTLFADYGSALCFQCGGTDDAFFAQQQGAKSIGIVSLSLPVGAAGCHAAEDGLKRFGLNVSFTDFNFAFGADPTADVLKMKQDNVDMLFMCLDVTGDVAFARAIDQNGLNLKQLWFNGYDRGTLQQFGSLMQGVYFGLQHVPFEAALAYLGVYPGLDTYIEEMNKYQKAYTYDEVALDGWIAADQFVTGLRAAGRNLTQAKLVAAINAETGFTADGLTPPVSWKTAHATADPPYCQAMVAVQNGAFVPLAAPEGQVFTCFSSETENTPVVPPPGTPGPSTTPTLSG